VADREPHAAPAAAGQPDTLPFDALILATGATDRVLPFPGWTLPGVFTLGAAQVALKAQATLVGPRVVFAGTGPLLYLVAWQYTQAGGAVQAVLDTAPAGSRRRALPKLLARPTVAAKGAYLLARLKLAGVPVHAGVRLLQADGTTRVQQLHWQAGHATAHHGLRRHRLRPWPAQRNATGRPGRLCLRLRRARPGLAAAPRRRRAQQRARCLPGGRRRRHPRRRRRRSGRRPRRAGAAGRPGARCARQHPQRRARPHQRFREGLEALCPLPADWAASAPDTLVVCRCEEVTAGELRACVRDTGTQRAEPPEGADAHRHGPLPGPHVRTRGGAPAGRRRRLHAGRRGPAAQPAAGQAGAGGGAGAGAARRRRFREERDD
jgi:hydrogen cyanide synthase HcnB